VAGAVRRQRQVEDQPLALQQRLLAARERRPELGVAHVEGGRLVQLVVVFGVPVRLETLNFNILYIIFS
jgi:hypothetical protein